MITLESMLQRNSEIEAAEMGDELGMLNVKTGMYFILNGVGADIWRLLSAKTSFADLVTQLQKEYEVSRDQCIEDTQLFLAELIQKGLVEDVPNR